MLKILPTLFLISTWLVVYAQTPRLVLPIAHTRDVISVAFSPDGKLVVTGSYDYTAKIWEVATGRELHSLEGYVISPAFSPNGKLVVTGSHDHTAKIWEIATGQELHSLEMNTTSIVNLLSFSPDSRLIVTGSFDSSIKIWEVDTGQELHSLQGHAFWVVSVAFSPDGKLVVTGSHDHTAKIWEVANGSELHSLKGHADVVHSAAFSTDGKLVVTGSGDHTAKIWEAATGSELHSLQGHADGVHSAAFSPDGKLVVTGSDDHTAKIWEVATGQELHSLQGHTWNINSVAFNSNGKLVMRGSRNSGGDDGSLVAFSPDGKLRARALGDPTAIVWEFSTFEAHYLKGHTGWVSSVAFSPDSKLVVTGSRDNTAKIWEAATGSELHSMQGHTDGVNLAAFSPDGKLVVTGSRDNTAKIWEAATGSELHSLQGHTGWVNSITFSPDGKLVVTSSSDHTAKIWEIATGSELHSMQGHTDGVNLAAFSPDGKLVVTGSGDHTAKIWEVATGQELHSLNKHADRIDLAAFSPDSKLVLTGSWDNTVKVWEVTTGNQLYTHLQLSNADWLAYDEHYRFDGSERARNMLYLVCGLEVIELNQVKDQLYVPGLAAKIMAGDSLAGFPKLSDLDICGVTPSIKEITSDTPDQYRYRITPRKGDLSAVEVYINDKRTFTFQPEELVKLDTTYELVLSQEQLRPFLINGTDNPIRVVGLTLSTGEGGTLKSRGVIKVVNDKNVKQTPNLYAVMVGVSDYKDDALDLNYSAKDANDLSQVLSLSAQKLLNEHAGEEHVFVYNLVSGKTNAEPLRENIKHTLAEIGKQSKAEDIILLFFAGHGVMRGTEEKEFTLLTAEASQYNQIGISTRDLQEWLSPTGPNLLLAQKRILIFDACNSGQANKDLLVLARNDDETRRLRQIEDLKDKSGVFILSASAPDQNAYEFPQFEQGLLTYALLKTLKQNSEVLEEGNFLNVSRWFGTVETEVRNLTRELGREQDAQPFGSGNINIGLVDEEVRSAIHLARDKPVIASANFTDATTGLPNFALTNLINSQLSQIAARGTESSITFMATNENGYIIYGITTEQKAKISCKVNILKSGTPVHAFDITGNKDELALIAENIMQQAIQWISENYIN